MSPYESPTSARLSARVPALPSVLLAMLAALLLLTLLLPQINPASWLGRAQPLVLGPADNPIATLTRHALLYKSDSRGLYLVVRSQWQLRGPLQEGDKVRVELLNERGERIDQLSQPVDKRQLCRKGRCTLDLNSTLRAPTTPWPAAISCGSACCSRRGRGGEFSQILQTLPERGFNLTYLCTSLLLVLALSAAVLKVVLPTLRRNLRWRIAGSLLLGNLTFVLLHGFVVFKLGNFCSGQAFARALLPRLGQHGTRLEPLRAGGLQPLHGAGVHGAVRHRAAGEFHEDRHLRGTARGDDLGNLVALLRILLEQHPVLPLLGGALALFLCWRFALSRWILRTLAATAAFFALCVFATRPATSCWGPTFATWTERSTTTETSSVRGPASICSTWWTRCCKVAACFAIPCRSTSSPLSSATSA